VWYCLSASPSQDVDIKMLNWDFDEEGDDQAFAVWGDISAVFTSVRNNGMVAREPLGPAR
jgi:hypothetical protein